MTTNSGVSVALLTKEVVNAKDAPVAIGPYSHACKCRGFVFTSGQLGLDPVTRVMAAGIEEQTRLCFKNLKAVLEASGSSLECCVKLTVFVTDLTYFATINEIYTTYFQAPFPARTCVEVSRLPKDALVEIEAIAHQC